MSLDGKTALANGESKWITSESSRSDVQRLRAMSSAIVTGVQTVIDDDPRMDVRDMEALGEHAEDATDVSRPVFILDPNLRIPDSARLLQRQDTVLVCAEDKPAGSQPVEMLTMPRAASGIDLEAILRELARREYNDVLFECGPTLAASLVRSGLVDEIVIYIAPVLMGATARSLLNLPEIDRMSDLVNLEVLDLARIGEDIRLTLGLK
jgi:diaminohydroxyphosphoribosylaminopyrimidine deaminase/5-amino-6-(5-phosphoribosylamino)uracil reductase